MGTRSAVRLAAWIPATRAAASTSPLVMALLATLAVVSGFMTTLQRARARRWVASLGDTSTMRVPLNGSRWLRLRSLMRSKCTGRRPSGRHWHSLKQTANPRHLGSKGRARLPTYEYRCDSCQKNFDVAQSFHDDPLTECPTCGSPVRKVFGSVGIVFKGSGFYKTDSRSGGSAKAKGSSAESSGSESNG